MISKRNGEGLYLSLTLLGAVLSASQPRLLEAACPQFQLLNPETKPTLRYPVAGFSGKSIFSLSYGWFDVTKDTVRYTVVHPTKKQKEGFEVARNEMTELNPGNDLYLKVRASGRNYRIFYFPQDGWGSLHVYTEAWGAARVNKEYTSEMEQAIGDFDRALTAAKGPGRPPPPPQTNLPHAPPPPPTIVLLEPSVSTSGQTIDANTSLLTIRGVATSTADFPVEGVSINGAKANTKARTTQAVDFWSEPISLKAGENKFEVTAVNNAPASAKISFTIRFTPMAPHYNPKALAKADILYFLKGDVSSARVAELIKERGIKFNPTAVDLGEIRSAGGSEDLIEALRQAAGSSK